MAKPARVDVYHSHAWCVEFLRTDLQGNDNSRIQTLHAKPEIVNPKTASCTCLWLARHEGLNPYSSP